LLSVRDGTLKDVLEVALFEAFAPTPVVLQFAVVPTAVPEKEIPTITVALVQVPLEVSELELDTSHPIRYPFVDPWLPVAIDVHPVGNDGIVLLASEARMSLISPVAVPLKVHEEVGAPHVPSRAVPHATELHAKTATTAIASSSFLLLNILDHSRDLVSG
jgi:hypothetical protein